MLQTKNINDPSERAKNRQAQEDTLCFVFHDAYSNLPLRCTEARLWIRKPIAGRGIEVRGKVLHPQGRWGCTLRGWRLEEGDFQGGAWACEAIKGPLHIYCVFPLNITLHFAISCVEAWYTEYWVIKEYIVDKTKRIFCWIENMH